MTDTPLVTIAIPTFNRAHTLRRALESVLEQDYERCEIIVCDNGSTDATSELLAETSRDHPGVIVLRSETNQGAPSNFRRGLDAATGDYFAWLADDDWIEPDFVRRCVERLEGAPAAILAHTRARYYYEDGTTYSERAVELMRASAALRVVAYYQTVSYNGAFYGLSRTADRRKAPPLDDNLASDWIHVAALAAMGQLVSADSLIHRSATGGSWSIARGWLLYPVVIARLAFKETARRAAFDELGAARLVVAIVASLIIVWRFGLVWSLGEIVGRVVRLLRSCLGPAHYNRARSAYRTIRRRPSSRPGVDPPCSRNAVGLGRR